MQPTSLSFLEQLKREDGDAWQRFDTLYRPLMLHWVRRGSTTPSDWDDLCQNVMTNVYRALPKFEHRGLGSFRGWMRKIMGNELIRHGKQTNRVKFVELGETLAQADSELGQAWDLEHDHFLVGALTKAVKEEVGEVSWRAFDLVFFQGKKSAEVAAELNMSVGSVYTNTSRVLARFRTLGGDFLH